MQFMTVIIRFSINNNTLKTMNHRSKATTRSIFYRGISLKDYLRSSPQAQSNLGYRYEETNMACSTRIPLQNEPELILSTPKFMHEGDSIVKKRNQIVRAPGTLRKSLQLPSMSPGKQIKFDSESYPTERNSTDTSLGSELDPRIGFLPAIEKKVMIRERNITMASREESSEPSCRKKMVEMRKLADPQFEEPLNDLSKKPQNKKNGEEIRKQKTSRERHNVRENIKFNCNKSKYFERALSYNE